ncbi:hypothetical protein HMPREF0576_0016 [Mobiluncus holmesii ATCC 35242]|uniref:Uncharacterized protein n=1 Tax=Mobiluncus holmesii ATCC 35242 TaxID=887899 RepID=E6M1E1_9ACTO|nr:hypothetical protein HMPREF0576_0016 [Mobiluncus holmesii ATCC 35242]
MCFPRRTTDSCCGLSFPKFRLSPYRSTDESVSCHQTEKPALLESKSGRRASSKSYRAASITVRATE